MQVLFTNKYSIKGSELQEYQTRKEQLEKEISLLDLEISKVSSMSYVEVKANQLGFVEYSGPIITVGSSQFAAANNYQ